MTDFTPEEITAMAREAGLVRLDRDPRPASMSLLERFAALVAEKAAAKKVEECAQLIETTEWWKAPKWQSALCPITKGAIAAAIRARGQKGGV